MCCGSVALPSFFGFGSDGRGCGFGLRLECAAAVRSYRFASTHASGGQGRFNPAALAPNHDDWSDSRIRASATASDHSISVPMVEMGTPNLVRQS